MDTIVIEQGREIQRLLDALRERGFTLLGPTLRDEAIVYDEIATLNDLPRGVGDEQGGGHYRLTRRNDEALFGYVVGPQSWKKFLHPPVLRLWSARREGDALRVEAEPQTHEKFAFIGARSCELHAIAIQDRVFLGSAYVELALSGAARAGFHRRGELRRRRRQGLCVSMDTGPKATMGFDLALTEIVAGRSFLVEAGTQAGSLTSCRRWHDQFGTSGCVGCGRCITWCPVGIDITAEVPRFRGDPPKRAVAKWVAVKEAAMEGLERIVSEHRLFHDLGPEFVNLAAGCAKNARFDADQYLSHADDARRSDLS